jgi:hypothetical protein
MLIIVLTFWTMEPLTAFGLIAVSAMLFTYALEKLSTWFILAFAASCLMGSAYGFLQGAWPFGIVEAVWAGVAARRWWLVRYTEEPRIGRRKTSSR